MAGNLPFHPAPGIANGGSLPAGFLAVPNTEEAARHYGVTRVRGIADIIPGAFSIPENPIVGYTTGNVQPLGVSGCGCGCGGHGGCGGATGSLNGIGVGQVLATDYAAGNYMQMLSDPLIPSIPIPLWGYLAAIAFVALTDFGSGSVAVRGKRAARGAYKAY